jgi:hypothetical protein
MLIEISGHKHGLLVLESQRFSAFVVDKLTFG